MGKRIALFCTSRTAKVTRPPRERKAYPCHASRSASSEDEDVGLIGFNAPFLNGAQHAQTVCDMADHASVSNFNGVHRAANLRGLVDVIQKKEGSFPLYGMVTLNPENSFEKRPSPNQGIPAEL